MKPAHIIRAYKHLIIKGKSIRDWKILSTSTRIASMINRHAYTQTLIDGEALIIPTINTFKAINEPTTVDVHMTLVIPTETGLVDHEQIEFIMRRVNID